ncbi:nineteen complex-related protein 2-domain-containing protein [Xylariaceae sp. FL0804]|nr:nineteen complex-related protein 2-domain-containing protein [Xylariaceae sp. FL0804]
MSAFGAKRKARKITVHDDNDPSPSDDSLNPGPEPQGPALQASFKSRKPFKQSSLRKSINIHDDAEPEGGRNAPTQTATEDTEEGGAPLRMRPPIGRIASTKSKKRQSSSRLSFGPGEAAEDNDYHGDDDDSMVVGAEPFTTPRKPGLAAAATENSALRRGIAKNLPLNRLPVRSMDNDDDRPRYSKEYLSELQSSTPNTPQDLSKLHPPSDEDDMSLDPSELEGAMIVDTGASTSAAPPRTAVLTEAEIQEKKARRARLAQQQQQQQGDDFISLSEDDDRRGAGESYLTVLSSSNNKKEKPATTRLVAEDEDLGEGFDAFVEDGGLSLGRRAEREARRRRRRDMEALIQTAEGGGGGDNSSAAAAGAAATGLDDQDEDDDDDSEAERLAAYEATQTRAGMDGLAAEREKQQQQRRRLGLGLGLNNGGRNGNAGAVAVPPRIAPLPDLSVLVASFRARVARRAGDAAALRQRLAELRAEREEVRAREPEVQRLLDEAGERYRRALTMGGGAAAGNADASGDGDGDADAASADANGPGMGAVAAARSLLEQAGSGGGGGGGGPGTPGERGLDSLGTTPVRQPRIDV